MALVTLTASISSITHATTPETKKVLATICCKDGKYVGDSNDCTEGDGNCQDGRCTSGAFEFTKAKCGDIEFE